MAPAVALGLARARVRFVHGDFWGAHEDLERAWHVAPRADRELLQGLILAAAGLHKHIVQDNVRGATRLLRNASSKLERYPDDALGVDLAAFRGALRAWRARLNGPPLTGAAVGLPRIEWSSTGLSQRTRVDAVRLYRVEHHGRRAVLAAVESGGETGWGESRLPWGSHGTWDDLALALAPALLAEPVSSPGELPLLWADMAGPWSRAGLEAAVWDVWARRRAIPLCEALSMSRRPVELAARWTAADADPPGADGLVADGYRAVILSARPNADRRVVPARIASTRLDVIVDLGGAYRASQIHALRVLDDAGPVLFLQPAPAWDLDTTSTLARWLHTPVSAGGWRRADEVASAVGLAGLPAVHVDPGALGPTESLLALDVADEAGAGASVVSHSVTSVGAATDLAVAVHPAVCWPSDLGAGRGWDGASHVRPSADGTASPDRVSGHGVVPDGDWLASVTNRRIELRA